MISSKAHDVEASELRHAARTTDASGRVALRAAAVAVDGAVGPVRPRDAEEALSLWRMMVGGEWTLVDHFEHDGKRLLVARRNRPNPPDDDALSAREREVMSLAALGYSNKLTAYALGLSPSTVATHMRHATGKLGARTHAQAVRSWIERGRAPRPKPLAQ